MAERKFTDLELERALVGELDAKHASDADRARLEELRTEHQAFLSSVDVAEEVRGIHRRVAKLAPKTPERVWWRWIATGGALAAAVAAILVFVFRKGEGEDIGFKGDGVTLVLHAASGTRLATGDTVTPGTRIRFEVNASKPGYIAIVGIDGTGQSTVYYPFGAAQPIYVDPKTNSLLPGAVELDATPGDERFFAVYAAQPFALDDVMTALRRDAQLPTGVASSAVVLHKK